MGNISIVKRIMILFALVAAVFTGILLGNLNANTSVADLQLYQINFMAERGGMLDAIHIGLVDLSFAVSATFNNTAWLAAADAQSTSALQASIDGQIDALEGLALSYKNALFADPYVNDIAGFDFVSEATLRMGGILAHLADIRYYFRFPQGGFDVQQNAPFELITERNANPTRDLLYEILDLRAHVAGAIGAALYGYRLWLLHFNIAMAAVAGLLIFALFLPVTLGLKRQVADFLGKARDLKRGDFSVSLRARGKDEFSALSNSMGEVVGAFSSVIYQIIKTADDIKNGRLNARINEAAFEGVFRAAAANVNLLAENAMLVAEAKAEAKVKEELSGYMQFIMDTIPVSICLWDENYNIVSCNKAVADLFGLEDVQEYMDNFLPVFSPALQPNGQPSAEEFYRQFEAVMKGGFAKFEWLHQDKGGGLIPVEVYCHKVVFMRGFAMVSYSLDMRDFHKALKEAERSALFEENSQAKSRFLAHMSHEIRTPINAVLGIAEIQLQNPALPMPIEESFAKIHNSAQILLGIINDILDLSKIESGKMEILDEAYKTASLINDIVQINLFRMGSKKIKFDLDIGEGLPALLRGDELRIKQIASNLLSNAFKYTDKGTVSLSVKFLQGGPAGELGGAGSVLCFRIADTGYGMSEEDLSRIFTEFERFNDKQRRHIEGIGLGMAIVDNLARLMGAKLKIESAVGVGTVIDVEIPQKRESEEGMDAALVASLKNFNLVENFASKKMLFTPEPMPYGRVLVVDDVDTNLFVAKGLLSFYDIEVETASGGQEALDFVRGGNVYDIIFMDQMMPGMDGIEATRLIREAGYSSPVVALTANALIGQAEVFMQNGFDGFISKPIDSSYLNSILNKFIRDRHPEDVVQAARQNAAGKGASGPDMSKFEADLRSQFAKSQKNAAREITASYEKGDMKSARRFAHTLKGLAYTIKESSLGDIARKLEAVFEKNGDGGEAAATKALIEELEGKLSDVIESIFAGQGAAAGEETAAVDVAKILEDLLPLLQEASADSLALAEQLKSVPQAAILVKQIEDFDFEGALVSLPVLKNIA